MIYRQGTVNVVNGSNEVVGISTRWNQLSSMPCTFCIDHSSPINKIYEVIKIIDSSNLIYLSEPFNGTTANGKTYRIDYDFTPRYKLPLTIPTEFNIEEVITEAIISFENVLLHYDDVRNVRAIDSRLGTYVTGLVDVDASTTTVLGIRTYWDNLQGYDTLYFKLSGDNTVYKVASIDSSSQLTLETNFYNEFNRATWPTTYEIVRDVSANFKLPLLSTNMNKPWSWITYVFQLFEEMLNATGKYPFLTIDSLQSGSTLPAVTITTDLILLSIDSLSSTSSLESLTLLHGGLLVIADLASASSIDALGIFNNLLVISSLNSLSTLANLTLQEGDLILNFERLYHNSVSKAAKYFVQIPKVNTEMATYFFMYYGSSDTKDRASSAFTWDDNYVCVLHGKDRDSGSILDSTKYFNSAIKGASNHPQQVDGSFYKAQHFNLTYKDHAAIRNDRNSIQRGTQYTVSLWYKGVFASDGELFGDLDLAQSVVIGRSLSIYDNKITFTQGVDSISCTDASSMVDNTLTKITASYDGSTMALLVNDTFISTATPTAEYLKSTLKYSYLGCVFNGNYLVNFLDGSSSEFKLSNTGRSMLWSLLEYYSESNQLLSFDAEEAGPFTVFGLTYNYRRRVSIDYTKMSPYLPTYHAELDYFPILVSLDASSFGFNKALSTGNDVLFIGYSG